MNHRSGTTTGSRSDRVAGELQWFQEPIFPTPLVELLTVPAGVASPLP